MKRINLTIRARSPLAIGQKKPGGSVSEALDYIPGTVIRGAIAAQMLRYADEPPEPGDVFHRLFVDDTAAIFSNGYCAIAAEEEDEKLYYIVSDGDIRVLPASALSAKTKGGFKPKTGVFDCLIDSFCAQAHGHFYNPNDSEGNLVDTFSGFYSAKGAEKGTRYYSHKLNKRLLTRVGINRRRATAQDEMLYSIEVMDESYHGKNEKKATEYRSSILIRDEENALAKGFCTFLKQQCQNLRLGGSASRGLGKVSIDVSNDLPVVSNKNVIQQRVKAFNEKLQERRSLWSVLGKSHIDFNQRQFFTLNFQSDAILRENWQRITVVSAEMLAALIGAKAIDACLHAAYTSYDYRSGWNAAWGLSKDTELVTNKGSVLLFSLPTVEMNQCWRAFVDLERNGIGERCSEGYGQITICDDFHQVMREAAV